MEDIPSFLQEKKVGRKTIKIKKLSEPKFIDCDKLTGQEYSRLKDHCLEYYRMEGKSGDFKSWTINYLENNKYAEYKDVVDNIRKVPDNAFGSTLGGICRMLSKGMPDVHEDYNKWWESLPGTIGTPKPMSDFVKSRIDELNKRAQTIIEEKAEKAEEEKKKEVYKPTIQERINAAIPNMIDAIEHSLDEFVEGKRVDFKDVKPLSLFRQLEVKQPHAKIIFDLYEPALLEMRELLNPPDTSKMSDLEKDYVQQLKEGYDQYNKKQVKQLHDFYVAILTACEGIIAERKANRKPRKMSAKAPEKVVAKLKYKVVDEKYGASVEAHKFISKNMLVIFNCKNRKLGVYYTNNEDPLGQGRDGTGLYLKGQTIQRYNEEQSVWKTLRKPVEQLAEVRENLTTRRKFENWWDTVKTTPTKMNGRINPETILIGVY